MTLTVAKLQRAKRLLSATDSPGPLVFVDRGRVIREQDESILAQFQHWFAIDGWRDRFRDPANNPFRGIA